MNRLTYPVSLALLAACGSDTTIVQGTDCTALELDNCAVIECPAGDPVEICGGADGAPGVEGPAGVDGTSCSVERLTNDEARITCEDGTETRVIAPYDGPTVTGFVIEPPGIPSTVGGTVQFSISTSVPTGVAGMRVVLRHFTGEANRLYECEGQRTCTVEFEPGAQAGLWETTLQVWDDSLNYTVLGPDEIYFLGTFRQSGVWVR